MGRPMRSLFMQRPISGLCVAWKPLMAPQAMVMKRQGNSWFDHEGSTVRALLPRPSHNYGISGHLARSTTINAAAIKSREKANSG